MLMYLLELQQVLKVESSLSFPLSSFLLSASHTCAMLSSSSVNHVHVLDLHVGSTSQSTPTILHHFSTVSLTPGHVQS